VFWWTTPPNYRLPGRGYKSTGTPSGCPEGVPVVHLSEASDALPGLFVCWRVWPRLLAWIRLGLSAALPRNGFDGLGRCFRCHDPLRQALVTHSTQRVHIGSQALTGNQADAAVRAHEIVRSDHAAARTPVLRHRLARRTRNRFPTRSASRRRRFGWARFCLEYRENRRLSALAQLLDETAYELRNGVMAAPSVHRANSCGIMPEGHATFG